MPENLDAKYPRVNFRVGTALDKELSVRADSGHATDRIAKRDLERYYEALNRTWKKMNPRFTLKEMKFLIDVFINTIFEPVSIAHMWAGIDDAVEEGYAERHEVNGLALITRFRSMSYFELLAVADAIERFWTGDNYHIENTAERIYALGLVKREEQEKKAMLEWNHSTGRYEAYLKDGHLVEVDGDVFAETRTSMRKEYMEQGVPSNDADERAYENLIDALTWTPDMHGVRIDGKSQEQ